MLKLLCNYKIKVNLKSPNCSTISIIQNNNISMKDGVCSNVNYWPWGDYGSDLLVPVLLHVPPPSPSPSFSCLYSVACLSMMSLGFHRYHLGIRSIHVPFSLAQDDYSATALCQYDSERRHRLGKTVPVYGIGDPGYANISALRLCLKWIHKITGVFNYHGKLLDVQDLQTLV